MTDSHRKQTVREAEFSDYLRQQLNEQSQQPLSPRVVQGLRSARQQALAAQAAPWTISFFSTWKPIASFATAMVLVFSVIYLDGFSPAASLDNDMDAELLFSEEGFQFYEDLEFYRWLANNNL